MIAQVCEPPKLKSRHTCSPATGIGTGWSTTGSSPPRRPSRPFPQQNIFPRLSVDNAGVVRARFDHRSGWAVHHIQWAGRVADAPRLGQFSIVIAPEATDPAHFQNTAAKV